MFGRGTAMALGTGQGPAPPANNPPAPDPGPVLDPNPPAPDAATPEPATLILLTTGAAGTVIARWRKPGGSIARRLLTFRGLCPISLGSDLADRDLRRRRPRRRRWAGRFHCGPYARPAGGVHRAPPQGHRSPRRNLPWRHPAPCSAVH